MIKRVAALGALSFVSVLCMFASNASAQEMPPPTVVEPAPELTPPPPSPPAAEPTTSTTTITSAEPVTYTAKEKSCGLINHSCNSPHVALALEGGVSNFEESGPFGFDTGVGSVSSTGPSWGLRVGVEALKWLAFDAHYVGMNNHANGAATPGGSVSLLTSGFTGEVRLTAPIPYVQPYILAGAGVYTTSITGGDGAQQVSPMFGSTELGVPLGVGLSVPIADGISAGAEVTYHRFFGEAFATDDEIGGGDLTTMNAVIRSRL